MEKLFSDVDNNVDLPYEINRKMQLSDVIILKHATYPLLTKSAKICLYVYLDQKKIKERLWMDMMINFEKALIKDRAQNICGGKCVDQRANDTRNCTFPGMGWTKLVHSRGH